MLAREKKGICEVSSEFRDFETFLEYLGRKEHPSQTLDRKDPKDKEYAPGKVRWATKHLQTRNRKNTIFLEYEGQMYPDLSGEKLTLSEWAELTNQHTATMRRRKSDGWTATENIEGKRNSGPLDFSNMSAERLIDFQPWPKNLKNECERLFLIEHVKFEDRFDFLIREVLPLKKRSKIEEGREIAFYMRNSEDLEKALSAYGASSHEPDPTLPVRDEVWCPHLDADPRDFEEFLKEYRDVVAAFDQNKSNAQAMRRRWLSALRSKRNSSQDGATAEVRERLRSKHGL